MMRISPSLHRTLQGEQDALENVIAAGAIGFMLIGAADSFAQQSRDDQKAQQKQGKQQAEQEQKKAKAQK